MILYNWFWQATCLDWKIWISAFQFLSLPHHLLNILTVKHFISFCKFLPSIALNFTFSPLKPCGNFPASYEWYTLLFLCCGSETLFSSVCDILDNHPPIWVRLHRIWKRWPTWSPVLLGLPYACILSPLHQPSNWERQVTWPGLTS